MDIRTQSALLASIVGLALGLSMMLRVARSRVVRLYTVFAVSVAAYYLTQFIHSLLGQADASPWLLTVAFGAMVVSGALVPSTAIGFFLEFLGLGRSAARNGSRIAWLSVVFGLAVGVTPLQSQTWARVALTVWLFGALFGSVSLLFHRMRQTESRIERARLMYLAIGASASVVFAVLDVASRQFDLALPTLGPASATLYLFFLAQTLLRLRLMDLHELLGKFASQAVLTIILAAVYAILTAWVSNNLSLFLFNAVLATFVVTMLLDPLRGKVEEQVVALFFRERFALMRSLATLRDRMANVIDVSQLASLVLDGLNETRRVTHTSIYLLAEDRPGYRLVEFRGPQPAGFLDTTAARGLLNAAAAGQKAVLLEHLERRIAELKVQAHESGKRARDEAKRVNDTRAALLQMRAGITVPLVGNDRVIGFLNLWDERVPEAFASDEIALVLEIGERLAVVIENSKLYEKMRERDRLAALGEMSAGLAHEIRNPLGAIKGAAQMLDPRRLPGEEGEFLEVIVEEVNRLNGVVTAFLDYARPLKQHFGPTDINEVVARTVKLIQNDLPANVAIKVEHGEGALKAEGDAEQLKQVLINLVQNAIQAFDGRPGTITIRTTKHDHKLTDFRSSTDIVELQVADDGPGIPADQQAHIFVPFFTTKQKGTGLGLAICQRIVKNHGGSISVQSRPGDGSTFVVRLPSLAAETTPLELPADGTPFPGTLQSPITVPPAIESEAAVRARPRKKRAGGR